MLGLNLDHISGSGHGCLKVKHTTLPSLGEMVYANIQHYIGNYQNIWSNTMSYLLFSQFYLYSAMQASLWYINGLIIYCIQGKCICVLYRAMQTQAGIYENEYVLAAMMRHEANMF